MRKRSQFGRVRPSDSFQAVGVYDRPSSRPHEAPDTTQDHSGSRHTKPPGLPPNTIEHIGPRCSLPFRPSLLAETGVRRCLWYRQVWLYVYIYAREPLHIAKSDNIMTSANSQFSDQTVEIENLDSVKELLVAEICCAAASQHSGYTFPDASDHPIAAAAEASVDKLLSCVREAIAEKCKRCGGDDRGTETRPPSTSQWTLATGLCLVINAISHADSDETVRLETLKMQVTFFADSDESLFRTLDDPAIIKLQELEFGIQATGDSGFKPI